MVDDVGAGLASASGAARAPTDALSGRRFARAARHSLAVNLEEAKALLLGPRLEPKAGKFE